MACSTCEAGDIEEFSFGRKEMFSVPLAGTVERYDGHAFICVKSTPEEWPSEAMNQPFTGGFKGGEFLQNSIKKVLKGMPEGTPKMRVNLCHALSTDEEGDILFFPPRAWSQKQALLFKAPTEAAMQTFVDEVIAKGKAEGSSLPSSPIKDKQIFVCCHNGRDKRCGVCGPPLVSHLTAALKQGTQVRGCSHVGGHAYAGNVLMYGVDMDWYGYVRPSDVPAFAIQAEGDAQTVPAVKLWRGRMGLTPDEHKAMVSAAEGGN